MKIRFDLPWGGEFVYERELREPIDRYKFYAVCVTICVVVAMAGFFGACIFA